LEQQVKYFETFTKSNEKREQESQVSIMQKDIENHTLKKELLEKEA
jgi:hypothetical protein